LVPEYNTIISKYPSNQIIKIRQAIA